MPRKPLTKERILDAALKLIDRKGLAGFSARKLGGALGVEAMSVYHHFPSQAHLLDAMMDRLIAELPNPLDLPRGDQRFRDVLRSYRDLARRHPRFFPYIAMHRWNTEATLRYLEGLLSLFRDEGFDPEMTVRMFRVAGYFLTGVGMEENTELASAAVPVSLEEQRTRFPRVFEAAPFFAGHRDDAFELGVELLATTVKRMPRRAR